jgi:hypothetical protein
MAESSVDPAMRLRHARHEEQVRLHDDVVDEVEHRPHDGQWREEREAEDHVSDLADDVE